MLLTFFLYTNAADFIPNINNISSDPFGQFQTLQTTQMILTGVICVATPVVAFYVKKQIDRAEGRADRAEGRVVDANARADRAEERADRAEARVADIENSYGAKIVELLTKLAPLVQWIPKILKSGTPAA